VVTATGVREYLDVIEAHRRIRSIGRKELFATLASRACIPHRDYSIANGNLGFAYDVLGNAREVVLLDVSFSGPWREVSHLS
jgi:hypothetical protein